MPYKKHSSNVDTKRDAWQEFKFRYNALFHVEQRLAHLEEELLLADIDRGYLFIIHQPEASNPQILTDAIDHLHNLLQQQPPDNIRHAIYYQIARAYYLQANYYTAIAYLDLVPTSQYEEDAHLLRAQALYHKKDSDSSLKILHTLNPEHLPKNKRATYYATKAVVFQDLQKKDSSIFYLQEALSHRPPKYYKAMWQLQLGKLLAPNEILKADKQFKKVASSLHAASPLTVTAHLERIKLQHTPSENKILASRDLLRKGFTINKEWLIYSFIADEYQKSGVLDSAMLYYDQIVQAAHAPLETKNYTHWQMAQLYVVQQEFDLAASHLDEIVLASAQNFSEREIVLIRNKHKWLPLLSKCYTEQDSDGRSQFELAQFYLSLGLQKDAFVLLDDLVQKFGGSNQEYVLSLTQISDNSQDPKVASTEASGLFLEAYNELYAQFEDGDFDQVIHQADHYLRNNSFSPQAVSKLAYLRAMTIGYSQPVDSLLQALDLQIANNNFDPLLHDRALAHVMYIRENISDFNMRPQALERSTGSSVLFDVQPTADATLKSVNSTNNGTLIVDELPNNEPYYFLILIDDASSNLTPTRYAIGQFMRTQFPHASYKHALVGLKSGHQLIRVGVFESLEAVRLFENRIVNLLPEIIKVREKKYSTFVIPKKEFDGEQDVSSISKYLNKNISK